MFLLGMKVMSEGIQQSAGDKMRKALGFMTGNRFAGVLTGFVVTAIIQSSAACTVLAISFVNAGLISLTQSIGVIFGANVGTTLTAWFVSLVGFKITISNYALPAIGIGFILRSIKWKHKGVGDFIMGFGFLFLGLHFLTVEMSSVNEVINFDAIGVFKDMGFVAILIGFATGLVITILVNSSTVSTAIIITMAVNGIITYEMAAGMVMGSNVGTTISAPIAAIAGNTASMRAAMAHVLFNVIGACWGVPMLLPMLKIVDIVIPGDPNTVTFSAAGVIIANAAIGTHLAGLHTVYNLLNTALFLPFVNQFTKLICFIVKDKKTAIPEAEHYALKYKFKKMRSTPELKILTAEKEIRDMAGVVSAMYGRFSSLMQGLCKIDDKKASAETLCAELKQKEEYVDEMRGILTDFLIESTSEHLNRRTEYRVTQLLRVIGYIEEMSDDCYITSVLLQKSIKKNRIFSDKEMDDLVPYLNKVEEFLSLLQEQLGNRMTKESSMRTRDLEDEINKSRKKLQKLSRKRIEAGKDLKTELFFIDLVRRIEKLGDYCFDISSTLGKVK